MSRPKRKQSSQQSIKVRALVAHEDYDASIKSQTIEVMTQDPYFLTKSFKKLMGDSCKKEDKEVLRCFVHSTFPQRFET